MAADTAVAVRDLAVGYEGRAILEKVDFQVKNGEIFGFLGGSGCGKSTLLKTLIGLYEPIRGKIEILGENGVRADEKAWRNLRTRFGVAYQYGALFGSMTLLENVSLPLEEYSGLPKGEIRAKALEKLALVGLEKYADYMPSEISGGMMKRAGLARALATDPELLFFDEPSAGLDPVTSAELDRLLLTLRDNIGATVIMVTHELESVFSIVDNVIILDRDRRGVIGSGDPRELRNSSPDERVRRFLTRDGMTLENRKNTLHGDA